MPSYDDDLPTEEEEVLLKQLVDNSEEQQRIRAIVEVKHSTEKQNIWDVLENSNFYSLWGPSQKLTLLFPHAISTKISGNVSLGENTLGLKYLPQISKIWTRSSQFITLYAGKVFDMGILANHVGMVFKL